MFNFFFVLGHVRRALYGRIESYLSSDFLPNAFILNTPELLSTTSPETRQATKAQDYSVNWILGQGQAEIVNASSGKTINDSTSRLSKRSSKFIKHFASDMIDQKRVCTYIYEYEKQPNFVNEKYLKFLKLLYFLLQYTVYPSVHHNFCV